MRLTHVPSRLGGAPARLRAPEKRADPFYLTREWREMVAAVRAQRGYRCEECGVDMRGNRRALHADHIDEIKDGGASLDPLNIRLRCQACHNRKTAAARRGRHAG